VTATRVSRQPLARSAIVSAVITALGGLLFLGAVVYSSIRVQRATERVAHLKAYEDTLQKRIAERESTLARLTPVAAKGLGYVESDTITSPSSLSASLTASHAAESLAATGIRRRQGISVRYYPRAFERSVNKDIVLPVIRQAGFTLEERPTAAGMRDLGTNAIWFGNAVATDDVKLVALVLSSAGVQLRAIRPFRNPTGPKRNAIEIGADRQEVTSPVWTVPRLLEAAGFTR
jgi:hypothetical protein